MDIQRAIALIEHSLESTTSKREIATKTKLLNLLAELRNRNLMPEEKAILEDELDAMFANGNMHEVSEKDFKKKLTRFIEFLDKKLFLVVEGQYTGMGIAFGILAGFIIFNVASMLMEVSLYLMLWIPVIFMTIGLVIGYAFEAQANRLGRILRTRI